METTITMPAEVEAILDRLHESGYEAYAVGGCVRDSLLGKTPHDWDICTGAKPEETLEVFKGEKVIPTGLKHGTVTLCRDHEPYEITTFRTEGTYSDGRHPDRVSFLTDVRQDLERRDFTVNAMAYSNETGLVDPFHGREDLEKGILRCVGSPEARYREDALRIFRAVRFAARFDFTMEEETWKAGNRLSYLLEKISLERITAELKGTLLAAEPGKVLMNNQPILTACLPELSGNEKKASLEEALKAVDAAELEGLGEEDRFVLRLSLLIAAALPEEDREAAADALLGARLRLSKKETERVTRLSADRSEIHPDAVSVKHRMAGMDAENLALLYRMAAALGRVRGDEETVQTAEAASAALASLRAAGVCTRIRDLAVSGEDLKQLGISGPKMGSVLRQLLDAVMDETVPNQKESLLALAAELKK